MELTRKQVMEYNVVFNLLAGYEGKLRFHYILRKNIESLKSEVSIVQSLQEKLSKVPYELQEYEEKRKSICEKYCLRKEDGTPKEENNNYCFTQENFIIINTKIEELKEEYKSVLLKDKTEKEEFLEFLKETVNVNLSKLKLEDMPLDQNIEQKYINTIFNN